MIVPMKSVSVLGLKDHTADILETLRETSVVHIQSVNPPEAATIEAVAGHIARIEAVLASLPVHTDTGKDPDDINAVVEALAGLVEKKKTAEDEVIQLRREVGRVAWLGAFNPADIQALADKGITLKLYEMKQPSDIPADYSYQIVSQTKEKSVAAVVFQDPAEELPLTEVPIPEKSCVQLEKEIAEKEELAAALAKEIEGSANLRSAIEKNLAEQQAKLELEKVRAGMGDSDAVVYLKGYCPAPEIAKLKSAAEKNAWGLMVEEASEEEEPPTLLKNPKWVNLIKPVFAIINTVPGYKEFDISMWFLLFFSFFFALLIGDAGYGALFLVLTIAAHLKLGKKVENKEPFLLMYILSVCTLIWGAVTGNWLGVEAIAKTSPFKDMIVPSLNAYSSISQTTVMNMCFIIGAVQLTIGHLLVFFRYINTLKCIAQLGWISILWAIFFLAKNLVLGAEIPFFFSYLLIGGFVLVAFFTAPQKNVIKGFLLGLADLPMTTINTFADNMSYIRLFAVGMSTLAVAQSFNGIAMDVGFGNVFTSLAAALILFLGHALNVILAVMAVIVHGVRLNMLEFSGHVGNTWSGYEYKPFKK